MPRPFTGEWGDTPLDVPKCLSCNGILGLATIQEILREGTWYVTGTAWACDLSVSGDGVSVVAHAGGVAVRLLADRVGLAAELSEALTRRGFVPRHDRGQVLVDVATMLAGGGEAIADIDTLRHQDAVLGAVASPPTVWRALDELTPARLRRVERARARTRARVWGPVAVDKVHRAHAIIEQVHDG